MKRKTHGKLTKWKTFLLATACLASTQAYCAAEAAPPPLRIAYNYCTLSYTFAYYSDAEWDVEIDRLAKAGYNVALVIDGTFKVWQATLRELGVSEEEIAKFIPDETARAWWLMDNLYGEGGPLDQKTIDEDGARGRRICAKMRAKGIEPILQGFYGMWIDCPNAVRTSGLRIIPQGRWQCYTRPPMIDPTCPAFAKIAAVWYRNLEKVYGFKPKYLAGDLFHEGGKSKGVDVTAAARAVQRAQQAAFPGVTWVVQGWQRNPTPALLAGLDPTLTLIEALAPQMNAFDKDDAVCNYQWGDFPWVWCEVLNFGGKHGLHGNLKTFARLGRAAKGKGAKTFRGYGSLSEGFFTNPVCYDLFEEMMMRPVGSEMTDEELVAWLDNWVDSRYGLSNSQLPTPNSQLQTLRSQLREAWKLLAETVYACPRDHGGPFENLICAKPAWDVTRASSWGPKSGPWYDSAKLEKALGLMKKGASSLGIRSNRSPWSPLDADVYDVERQVRANRFRSLLPKMKESPEARKEAEKIFASICGEDISDVPPEFRLATYENRARARAGERGVKAWRRMITTWSDDAKFGRSSLADYAQREYAELMREYYIPRWREFLQKAELGPKAAPLLPVIPQPAEWTPAKGECDLDKAKVSVDVNGDYGLGEEGYTMKITPERIEIAAGEETGRVWAMQTLAQLKAAGAKAPCGTIRDVPKYRVRAFMLDVGRMYHSMDFLYDLARTMSYYKMNTLHIHLNDNAGGKSPDKYAAFRLESETYPELAAKDGHYTKKDFRDFSLFCKRIGVTVIPEIDVPAHSLAFTRVRPDFASKKYGADHLDLDKSAEILAWLKPLFAEYMTGEKPTFIGPYVHVGTDEYNKAEAEKFRAFADAMFKMVKGFGFKPCAWGSFDNAKGKTPVVAEFDITMDIWNNRYYHPESALTAGYSIVTIPDKIVYLVPFAGYYNDYFDCRKIYETWDPRVNWHYTVPNKYLNWLAGGKFALWNDLCGKKKDGTPYTEADNWDRIHPALQTFSQKMWCGSRPDVPWEKFAPIADRMEEPKGVKSTHKAKLVKDFEFPANAIRAKSGDMVGDSAALVWPGVTLDALKGRRLGCRFTGEFIAQKGREGKGCNVRKTPGGKGLRVEFQTHDDKFVKCVLVDFTEGNGGVYARKVGTGYVVASPSVKVGHRFGDVSRKDKYEVFDLFAAP